MDFKKIVPRIIRINEWLLFIPFLLFYIVIIIIFQKDHFVGDESRYIMFANNLLNGFYSPNAPDINLWNGPGYPVLISVFLYLKLPLIILRLLNAIFLYLSLIFTSKTINYYSSKKVALFYSLLLGLYHPIFYKLPIIITECLSWFLISLICFLFIKNFEQKSKSIKSILLCSVSIAFLALTKVIFGYVILCILFISLGMCFFPKFKSIAKKTSLIFSLSLIFCLPYLFYTYNLTNKLFYWTNCGSMSLYTMSSPFENELGDWSHTSELMANPNHTVFMDSIQNLNNLKRDEAYKAKAIENIKKHPKKYFKNWVSNLGRLFFSFPFSNTKQNYKLILLIIPNMFIILFILLASALSIVRYKAFPKELIFLFLFIIIYLFGSSLVSAYLRMFYITIPFWVIFISYSFTNIIEIKFKT